MTEQLSISLASDISYVSGTVNGEVANFSLTSPGVWSAIVPKSSDDKYIIEITAYNNLGTPTSYSTTIYKVDDMIPGVVWRYNDYYNTEDLNRVEANTQFIADLLSSMGYNAEIQLSDSDWSMLKFPTNAQINRIELNLESLKNSFYTPPGYGNMKVWPQKTRFSYEDANRYERNLELLYKWAKLIYESYKYCGTFACGEEVI